MASIFISYSRTDKAFVQTLTAALNAAKRDYWLDENDIPPTAAWAQEIKDNIALADTFLYVLSPDSIAPTSGCAPEVDEALRAAKRIVPLVCRDIESRQVLPEVAALNWIRCRPSDDFNAAFVKLLAALDIDLDYWHQSAQYLVRARQWETKHENASFTLRGSDLTEAETWLAKGVAKKPAPTPLHVQYITASRRAMQRRQRVAIGLIGAIGVFVIAAISLQLIAQNNLIASQQQVQIAQTHLLASYPPTVENLNDSGPGSLRQAIADMPPGTAITFAKTLKGTLTLTSGPLLITKDLTIQGPPSGAVAISGNGKTTVFEVQGDIDVTLSGLTIEHGMATVNESSLGGFGTAGGGILSIGATLTVLRSTVRDNSAMVGGGIYSVGGTLSVINSTVVHNTAASNGGGINAGAGQGASSGPFSPQVIMTFVTGSTISDNRAASRGGGIEAGQFMDLEMLNSTVTGNSADEGGGVDAGSDAQIRFSTIYQNSATSEGGGINALQLIGAQGQLQMWGVAILSGDIVAGNTAPQGADVFGGASAEACPNLIQNPNGAQFSELSPAILSGKAPLLEALANNGGPTETMALLPGSPAIAAAHPDPNNSLDCTAPASDQRGNMRPNVAGVDLGAYAFS